MSSTDTTTQAQPLDMAAIRRELLAQGAFQNTGEIAEEADWTALLEENQPLAEEPGYYESRFPWQW